MSTPEPAPERPPGADPAPVVPSRVPTTAPDPGLVTFDDLSAPAQPEEIYVPPPSPALDLASVDFELSRTPPPPAQEAKKTAPAPAPAPEAKTPPAPAAEENYVPPPSPAVAALMPRTPVPIVPRNTASRDAMPAIPRPSDLRRSDGDSKGRSSWLVVMGVVGGLGLVLTGVVIVGGVAAWTWYSAEEVPQEPVEVVSPDEPMPQEVGGIPLERGIRRGAPPPGPKRPDSPP